MNPGCSKLGADNPGLLTLNLIFFLSILIIYVRS